MIQDMKTTLTRLFLVIMLMMFSMGASADVKVLYGEKGTEKFEGMGGTIEVKQEDSKDDKTKVTVTLIVTPADGYTMERDNSLEVYAVISPDGASTRALEISGNALKLDCDDFKDISEKRTYTTTIDSKLALWVKSATFNKRESGAKAVQLPSVTTSSNTYLYQINLAKNSSKTNYLSTYFMTPSSPKVSIKDNPGNSELWYVIETDDTPTGTFTRDHIAHYCYIVNSLSGEYLYYTGTNSNSIEANVVEMKDIDAEGVDADRFKFIIKKSGNSSTNNYWMFPKIAAENNKTSNNGNLWESNSYGFLAVGVPQGDAYYTNGSTLSKEKNGAWTSQWVFVSASLFDAPTITFNSVTNQFTISHSVLSSGCTIYYTTDNSSPSSSWTPYTEAVDVSVSATVRTVVIRDNIVLTNVGSLVVSPVITAPIVTNNGDGTISLNTTTTGTTIYYTTNGDTPDNTSTVYSSAFSLGNATVIKAIAYLGSESSEVTTYNVPQYDAPTISFNSSTSQVTITSEGTVYYNTGDGSQADPTTSSDSYDNPFSIPSATTVKAIATHAGYLTSEVATLAITQVATPTIQNNGSNAISITSATTGATIYYTTDGSTPTTSSSEYTEALTENVSGVTIKAIAVKENMITSAIGSGSVTLTCAIPAIVQIGKTVSITCSSPTNATIRYTLDGTNPGSSSTVYSGTPVDISSASLPITIKAYASATGYTASEIETLTITTFGNGTAEAPYIIGPDDFDDFISGVNSDPDKAAAYYQIQGDIDASGCDEITSAFTGSLEGTAKADGTFYKICNLSHALFNTIDGGTVKNIILDNVNITTGTNVGAIANEVTGTTDNIAAIYNCGVLSGSVSGSGYVGGLVGRLGSSTAANCYARVINCFSYANVSGGTVKAGIVGYNSYASKYNDLRTMVMNCMFYGDISTGDNVYPIYGGEEISNDYKASTGNRLNNYNYFLYEAPFSKNNTTSNIIITKYNCALAAEERFLVRFEFYRHLLNSNRELAAWYATGNAANGKGKGSANKMLKWVLDKSIAKYPILKAQDEYPSVVNYDEEYTFNASGDKVKRSTVTETNQGGIVKSLGLSGSLTIKIQMGNGALFNKPSGASLNTTSLSRPIVDKDPLQYNFNYGKVQLPYYNEVGTGNYTENRVVTGWKIVSMTGGTSGGYTETNYDAPNYNYADRDHYGKDIYGTGGSGRIFAQGGYFNVPTGVTAITIEPYWAKCAYLSNKYYDRYGYNTTDNLEQIGGSHFEVTNPSITIGGSNQTVYTTFAGARDAMGTTYESGATVYDYAVVLVGNYHHHTNDNLSQGAGDELSNVAAKPLTVTSVDLNLDNEPDYCLIFRSGKQKQVCPIRYDFITLPGMAMAHKMATHDNLAIPGNCKLTGWFEVTTTGLIKFGQFEHSNSGKTLAPLILMGGVIDQFVSDNSGNGIEFTGNTKYLLFGDNVWFLLLSDGTHSDKTSATPHRPISITGGEYETLYLSGYFQPEATACTAGSGDRNAKCYIDGGKFGEVAGAGQEKIDGNVTWNIDHADIENFFGGGINSAKAITGNISTTIKNSRVDVFCGGPKFGNMASTKTVETEATGCTFRKYFGGGFGGTSIYRYRKENQWESLNYINDGKGDWSNWISNSYDGSSTDYYRGKYISGMGVAVNYEYEFFGGSKGNVARLYIDYASFSLAQTNGVTSTLTGCTIKENFYGGGSLGAVMGDAISTLTNCTVLGNVFGAGYSVNVPTVTVRNTGGWSVVPYYNNSTAIYEEPIWQSEVTYTWDTQSVSSGSNALVDDGFKIKTNESLVGLGAVTGNVTLTLNGSTNVTGNVFGGGDASAVIGSGNSVTVNLKGNTTVNGDVFGGGNKGIVEGTATVNIVEQ